MNSRLTAGMLSGMILMAASSCNKIERNKDVGTTAAVSEELETTQLAALDVDGSPMQADTVINPDVAVQNPEETFTETEVVRIDTVSTRIVYDVRRRIIEEVDTVGATKTYEIKKTVLKRTVMLDTLTQTEDEEQTVAFQKGDFKKLDEQVKTDTVVEVLDYQSGKQQPTPTQPATTTQPERTSSANSSEPTQTKPTQAAQSERDSTASRSPDTEGTVRGNAPEQSGSDSDNQSPQSSATPSDATQSSATPQKQGTPASTNTRESPSNPSETEGTAKQDTTRRSDSGS